ncbi:MAG: hypothetical protein BA863_10455 [Desulfovibrio sp. S3730MH75]|nr:MAG: hypothetical protein BA863_10455 [Desulfovibrio sp. S3730MH75]
MSTDSGPPWPGFVDALSTVLMMMVFFTLLMVLVTGTLSYIVALKEVTPGATMSTEQVEELVAVTNDLSFTDKPSSMDKLQAALNDEAQLGEDDLMADPNSPEAHLGILDRENQELAVRLAKAERAAKRAIAELNKLKKTKGADTAQKLNDALEKIARLEAAGAVEKNVQTEETFEPPAFITKLVKGMNKKNRVIILYNQLTSTLEDNTRDELLDWVKQNESAIRQHGLLLTASLNHNGVSSSMSNSVSFKRLYGLIKVVNIEGGIPKKNINFKALSNAVSGTNQVVISLGKKKP